MMPQWLMDLGITNYTTLIILVCVIITVLTTCYTQSVTSRRLGRR